MRSPEEIAEVYRDYVAPFFPGVTAECVKSTVCLYTCTDDTRFIVDTLPGHDNSSWPRPAPAMASSICGGIGEAIAGRAWP